MVMSCMFANQACQRARGQNENCAPFRYSMARPAKESPLASTACRNTAIGVMLIPLQLNEDLLQTLFCDSQYWLFQLKQV